MKSLSGRNIKRQLLQTASVLGLMVGAHTGAMMGFEGMAFGDALWLSLTTATTVGYGDLSASTLPGRAATTLLMYGAGITYLAQTASLYFEYRQNITNLLMNGKWRWKMDDHVVILNSPSKNPNGYFRKLMHEFRKSALPQADKPVVIASPYLDEGLPDDLRDKEVAHVNESVAEPEAFTNSSLDKASVVAILSHDETDPLSDSVTFDLISRARQHNPTATIIAEAVQEGNKQRFLAAGATSVIRPIRSYPELLVRSILAPGSEQIVEDMFDSDGEEVVRYDGPVKGKWGELQIEFIKANLGTPLGYVQHDGHVVSNASATEEVDGKAVMVLAREDNVNRHDQVSEILKRTSAAAQPRP